MLCRNSVVRCLILRARIARRARISGIRIGGFCLPVVVIGPAIIQVSDLASGGYRFEGRESLADNRPLIIAVKRSSNAMSKRVIDE
ncbi:MAG: hypothetical protein ACI9BW_004741 [Gammaproteobacteria bacterium]|jgi:hypothetical protein